MSLRGGHWASGFLRRGPWFWSATLLVLALVPRVFTLDAMLNIDAVLYWSKRIPDFWDGWSAGEYRRTFQTHPGVTLMWASGLSQKIFGVLHAGPSAEFIVPGTLPVALFAALLVPANYVLVRRYLRPHGEGLAIVSSLALATEPFVVAQSRSLHVDMFFAGFAWLGVLLALLTTTELKYRWAAMSGLCLGLGVLSRATCLAVCVGVAAWFILCFLRGPKRDQKLVLLLLVLAAATLATTVLLWPSLLHDPVFTLENLVSRTEEMVERGHRLFFFGEVHQKDPGAAYYLALFALKTSPETLLGAIVAATSAWRLWRSPARLKWIGLFICYALVLVALLASSKKGARYFFPLFPLLMLVAAFGWLEAVGWLRRRLGPRYLALAVSLGAAALAGRGSRLIALHPIPTAYCPEYPTIACEEIITMGGGQGLREVALYLREHHRGSPAKVYDTPYVKGLLPWYKPTLVSKPSEAEYLVSYLSEKQRGVGASGIRSVTRGTRPVFSVQINGIRYADLFLGPRHPEYTK